MDNSIGRLVVHLDHVTHGPAPTGDGQVAHVGGTRRQDDLFSASSLDWKTSGGKCSRYQSSVAQMSQYCSSKNIMFVLSSLLDISTQTSTKLGLQE